MGLLSRLKSVIESQASAPVAVASALSERFSFSAGIPAGRLGALCQIDLQLLREPQQDGERLHLRAHFQSNLASVLRPALQRAAQRLADDDRPLAALPGNRALAVRERALQIAGLGLNRVLATPLVQRLAEPLLRHDLNTWVEVQASTEPLDAGAHDLVPQQERLAALGIRPARTEGRPLAENWSGQTPRGYAQLSVLQIDKAHLPADLARRLGAQPFQLGAAIVSTVERK